MAAPMRQVRFPLKIKLLTLMIVLIASSLIVFVGIALKTFREDKSAYIFETMLNKASSEQIILSQKLLAGNQGAFNVRSGKLSFGESDPASLIKKHLEALESDKNASLMSDMMKDLNADSIASAGLSDQDLLVYLEIERALKDRNPEEALILTGPQ